MVISKEKHMNSYNAATNTSSANINENDERILTEKEAAEYIRMSRSFLSKDRMNGYRHGHLQGPEFIRSGVRAIRYRKSDLDEWIVKNRVVRALPKW